MAKSLRQPLFLVHLRLSSRGHQAPAKSARKEQDEEDIELLVEFLDESYDEVERIRKFWWSCSRAQDLSTSMKSFVVHSIKGVASCCDLEDITNLTHITEEVLSDCRGKYAFKEASSMCVWIRMTC